MDSFDDAILNNWASRFGCSVSRLEQYGTTLLPDEKYAGQRLLILWHISKQTFALFDPSCRHLIDAVASRQPINGSISAETVRQVLGASAIASHDVGLVHYLRPAALPNVVTPASFTVRELNLSNREALAVLHHNCTPEEVDEGYVEVDHEIAFGCFRDDELVAAASGYRLSGFLDIGVLVHARFRKLGLAKVVVSALCRWSIANDIIAQYRCDAQNSASHGVAKALNFQHYFSSESILLATAAAAPGPSLTRES